MSSIFKNYFKIKNLSRVKYTKILSTLLLIYFFSNNFIYAQSPESSNTKYLIPVGNVLQIDAQLKNIVVRSAISNSPFQVGDSVLEVNDNKISSYGQLSEIINSLSTNEVANVLVRRNNKEISLTAPKEILTEINFNNLLSGFATLTYINPDTQEFGAVGHPINIGYTRQIPIKTGSISLTNQLNIKKSSKGSVGSLSAYKQQIIGEFNKNTPFGIKGKIVNYDYSKLQKYEIANLNEVKTGEAYLILQDDDGICKKYKIDITTVNMQRKAQAKSFKIKIVDNDLLNRTGGIVQGMSGTPIVQGNKIIGAVSHAVENDPKIGYGVYIKWMLNE